MSGIDILYGPPPPQDPSPVWSTGSFGLGYGADSREVHLWCVLKKTHTDHVICSVINGEWDFRVNLAEPTKGHILRTGHEFTFNVLHRGGAPFRRDQYNEAIAWMQSKVDAEVAK